MKVAEILSNKGNAVATITLDATLAEAVQLLDLHSIGALVVSADGVSIDGVISERDIVRHLAATTDPALAITPVRAVMSSTVRTCTPTDRVEGLRVLMTERRIRHLPVVNAEGALCGIVSIGDVVKSRVNELEVEHDQLVEYVRSGQ